MKTSPKRLSLFVTFLFSLISAASTAADMSGLNNLSPEQNSARVIESVSGGLFYDSTGASKSMMSEGYSDLCYNIAGTQTELPIGYTMVRPGYCRKPCAPVRGTTVTITNCAGEDSKTGYKSYESQYEQGCTGPYGTRSLVYGGDYSVNTNCVFKQFIGVEFMPTLRLEDKGTTVNFGVQFEFTDVQENKYTPRKDNPDVHFTIFTAYKSCNNPYRIREVIVGTPTSIQPDSIIGTTVSGQWYKSVVSDSNCTKVNFAGGLYLGEKSLVGADEMKRLTLRGLNQSKKVPAETDNGYQITIYNKSGQEITYCFGKFSAATMKWNHYSGCKDRVAFENTAVYGYGNGYTEPILPPAPSESTQPDPEPFDPYESPEMFTP